MSKISVFILLFFAFTFMVRPVRAQVSSLCQADITLDGTVDLADFSAVQINFFKTSNLSNPRADTNGDGVVDLADFSAVQVNFFKQATGCNTPSPSTSPSSSPIPIVNLLSNGGFETGNLNNWDGSTGIVIQNQDKNSGTYSAHFVQSATTRQGWVNVTPGKTYVVSAWFKWTAMSTADWGYSRISVNDTTWADIAAINNLDQLYQKNVWNKVAFTFIPTTNQVMINIGMFGPEPTVDMYFDDVMLYEKTGNVSPTLNPQADKTSGAAPLAVNFTANADDADGSIATYQWIFGDGSEERIKNPSHTYVSRGSYNVTLNVFDNDGAKASKSITINVTDSQAPQAQISTPSTTDTFSTANTTITLSGTANSVSSQITGVNWDNVTSGDVGIVTITNGSSINWNAGSIPLKPGTNEILVTTNDSNGLVATDKIVVTRTITGPTIQNVSYNVLSPKLYEKYEITFDVTTVADQPMFMYDPNPPAGVERYSGVTAEAVITLPGGQQVTQPAFYYVSTTNSGGNYRLGPVPTWKVRYSPEKAGTYHVVLRATDKSGTATKDLGNFTTATGTTKPGFIRVAAADPRYFEYSNGAIHFPIGMTWSGSTVPENGTAPSAINYDRPWMAGLGAWSSNWSRWISSAEGMGNEGIGMHYSYKEHYPTSEISQLIDYPSGWKMWISCWLDGRFCAKIDAGKTYQVKLRVKTSNIVQSAPGGGLVIKNHDWPPDNFETTMRGAQNWIPPITQNKDWHTIVTRVTAQSGGDDFSIYFDNVSSGVAYIDEFSVKEVINSTLMGAEQIRNPKADWHTYVEQRPMAAFDDELTRGEANGINLRYVIHDKNDRLINAIDTAGVFETYGGGYYQPENTKATWLLKQWWRYAAARLGYSTAVFGWELNNEGPPDDGTGPHARTTQIFAKWMHTIDAHKHLAGTSFWCCWEPTFWGDKTKFPDVDFGDIHHYGASPDTVQWHLDEAQPVINSNIGRPVVRGETGIMAPGSTNTNAGDPALNTANPGVWYHNLLWSQLHYSALFEIGYWYSDHGNAITGGRTPHAKAFLNFVKDLDINKGGYQNISATSTQVKFVILGQKNVTKNEAHGWVVHSDYTWRKVMDSGNPAAVSGTISFNMNPNRTYNVIWYDTYTGNIIGSAQQVTSNGSGVLTLNVTNLSRDIAFKIN